MEKSRNFLHIHSMFSVGDSAQSPDDIVRRVKELGGENVTLTDHRTLLGIDPFMEAGEKYGVNTIPGVEADVILPEKYAKIISNGIAERKEVLKKVRNHLVIIPYDYLGFQAMSHAMRDANTNQQQVNKTAYPCLTDEMLRKHFMGNSHVFASSACIQGSLGYLLLYNFRIKERIGERIELVEKFREDFLTYEEADRKEQDARKRLKALGKEITAQTKPLKKPFQKRLKNWRSKLEAAEIGSKGYLKAEMEVFSLEAQVKDSQEKAEMLGKKQELLTEEKEHYTSVKANTAKGHNRYRKITTEIESLRALLVDGEMLYSLCRDRLDELKEIFPHFYIELQYHGMKEEKYVMPLLLKLADETNTPIIASNDAHVTDSAEQSIEARRLIRFNFFKKSERITESDRQLYIKSDEELVHALSVVIPMDRAKEAVDHLYVLEQCQVVFPQENHYPKVKGGLPFLEMLQQSREEKIRSGKWNEAHEGRLQHEIKVIQSMGYVDYHMVVEHFCRIGRLIGKVPEERRDEIYQHFPDLEEWIHTEGFDTGVGIGPGRGSAVGSLVCYLLGITNIDPMDYDLLFERFLNPERVSMPDIDTDIASGIRPILIAYLRWYYGENAVCSIGTVTTYGAKAAIQLAGRDRADQLYGKDKAGKRRYLHEITYAVSDLIPDAPGTTLESCEQDVIKKIKKNDEMMVIWNRAKLVENCVSGTGIHAGGIIISDNDNVNDYVPLAWNEEKQVWVAQCDMIKAEEKGLLKMDLLGLNNLDIENQCLNLIKQYQGTGIDLDTIPFEDEVFREIYGKGNTNNVFQVESDGMKRMLREFQPTCFEDIILLVAAYRPGPMQYLDDVIAVKNGKKKVSYRHPMLEPILSKTYGAVIYQEQVMQIFQKLAGYSLGAADLVRRAMSKKKTEKLEKERKAFINGDADRKIEGCITRGVDPETAKKIFNEMMEFAKYAFNKSHAAAYSLVSYQTAWLKYHYPKEYLCALFNCKTQDKYGSVFQDCELYQIRLLPPDINASYYDFVLDGDDIRYGIRGIKGLGEADRDTVDQICRERKNGPYTSFPDFLLRAFQADDEGNIHLPKEFLGTIIKAGAFDSFFPDREFLLDALSEIIKIVASGPDEFREQLHAFEGKGLQKDRMYNFTQEVQLLGTVVSEHPLNEYREDSAYGCTPIRDLTEGQVAIFGFVIEGETMRTKNGADMIRITIEGKTGICHVLFLGQAYAKYETEWEYYLNRVVKVRGSCKDGTIFARSIRELKPGADRYCLDLKTYESQQVAESVNGLHHEKQDEDEAELLIQVHYYKSGRKLQSPILIRRFCTGETVDEIKIRQLKIVKQ